MAMTVIDNLDQWPAFVQNSVVFSAMKYMLCDANYAKMLAPKIFTAFEKTTRHSLEETVISCYYDLLIAHPNIITPWKNCIYGKLNCSRVNTQVNTIELISKMLANNHLKVNNLT
jgi:hypothetical protein